MDLRRIALEQWERREYFEYFKRTCMYLTVEIDVTGLLRRTKEQNVRFYPALVYCIAAVVQNDEAFRYGYDADGNVGIWDRLDPLYTVPRTDKPELFAMATTPWREDFRAFYEAMLADIQGAELCGRMMYNADPERQYCGITAVPGVKFSSFAFGDDGGKPDLTPFAVVGRYEERDGRILLPVCGEFSHAVNDGLHIERFFRRLQGNCDSLLS